MRWALLNQFFDSHINLLPVLALVVHPQEIFLLTPPEQRLRNLNIVKILVLHSKAFVLLKSCRLFLFLELFLLLVNEVLDQFFLIELLLIVQISLALLTHYEHGVVSLVPYIIIFHIFKHHVETIFDVVLRPSRHFLNDL